MNPVRIFWGALALLVISAGALGAQTTDELFRKYLVTQDAGLARQIIARATPADSLAVIFCRTGLESDQTRRVHGFSAFIAARPTLGLAQAYMLRGISYVLLDKNDSAIADMTQTLAINPNQPYGYYFRGVARGVLKQYDKAIEDYTAAIRLDSAFGLAYQMRANNYMNSDRLEPAVADYTTALKYIGDDEQVYMLRGMLYITMKKYDSATADLEKVKSMKGDYADRADTQLKKIQALKNQ